MSREQEKRMQSWVVKVGSSLITDSGKGLDHKAIESWVSQIADLQQRNVQVVLVSSGAVAEGMCRLQWMRRPHALYELQAAAAVGQSGLIQVYETAFNQFGLRTAQLLLTNADLANRRRYLNARGTLKELLKLGVIPIVNENDTVVTDEIKFGDNDTLGALVANLIDADRLVILTDQEGLYDSDPRSNPNAKLVPRASSRDESIRSMAGPSGSMQGTGGMTTKITAAYKASHSGTDTVIASGRTPNLLPRLVSGESIGTLLSADSAPIAARKQWLANQLISSGEIVIDSGAVKGLVSRGSSLLSIGVMAVKGEFKRGELVTCFDEDGFCVAKGLSNYSSLEARMLIRKPSSQIEMTLGYVNEAELIHRDNMVVFSKYGLER